MKRFSFGISTEEKIKLLFSELDWFCSIKIYYFEEYPGYREQYLMEILSLNFSLFWHF